MTAPRQRSIIPGGYMPIDELLEQPLVKMLRALRHFGWIDILDLLDVLNVAPNDRVGVQSIERNNLSQAMVRAARTGLIERRPTRRHTQVRTSSGRNVYDVRITPRGRDWLARRLTPDTRIAGPREVAARPGTEHLLCA